VLRRMDPGGILEPRLPINSCRDNAESRNSADFLDLIQDPENVAPRTIFHRNDR